jgi:hypothetical protein
MPIYLCLLECCARLSKYTAMASLSHRQSWSLAVLLAVSPCLLCAGPENDAPKITYRTGTSEVRVTFFATDENNRLVQAIDRNDFAVVDGDMVIRDFRSLTRSDETKLDVCRHGRCQRIRRSTFSRDRHSGMLSLVSRSRWFWLPAVYALALLVVLMIRLTQQGGVGQMMYRSF